MACSAPQEARVLLIYTGGTIGSQRQTDASGLTPVDDFLGLLKTVLSPHTRSQCPEHDYLALTPAIDSACIQPIDWLRIANLIIEKQQNYQGFVVLHGTDTMAYTASMLSFLLAGLNKPVVLTGSQIPLTEPHSDGIGNLLGALSLAAAGVFCEVGLYFDYQLLRACRSRKYSNRARAAFVSPNYPVLTKLDANGSLNDTSKKTLPSQPSATLSSSYPADFFKNSSLRVLHCLPAMQAAEYEQVLAEDTRGLLIVSYGAGNVPSNHQAFVSLLARAAARDVVMLNISQCWHGRVSNDYAVAEVLAQNGVINGLDMTLEAAYCKLLYLLGINTNAQTIRERLQSNLCGEISF